VETSEQAEFLRTHACDELQGFHFNRPLPPDEFAQLLRDQATQIARTIEISPQPAVVGIPGRGRA